MDIIVEDTGPCKKLLKVDVPYGEMKEEIINIQQSVQQKAAIPGFRMGKAPWKLIEQYYGGTIEAKIKENVVNSVFPKILEEKDLHPVKSPVVKEIKYERENKLTFNMEIETIPKFELPQYKGIKIKKRHMDITDKHIEEELKYLQEQHAYFKVVADRILAMGDFAVADYRITERDKNEALDQAKQIWIEMKQDFFIPKLCVGMAGMKPGEEREIETVLPEQYPKVDLRGKKVVVYVKLNEIKQKILPELNDEFAKEAGKLNTLDELKNAIKKQLELHIQKTIQKDMIGQIENYLLTHTKLELPQSVVDSFDDAIYKDTVSMLKASGRATDELIKEKDTEIRADTHKQAVDNAKLVYILQDISTKEKLDVSGADVDKAIAESAKRNGKAEEEIRDYLDKENKMWDFKYRMQNEKLMNFLLENANVEQVTGKEEEKTKK